MDIRFLSEDDAPAYYHLRLEGLERVPRAFGTSAQEFRERSLASVVSRIRQTEDQFTLGAFQDGQLIGMATFVRSTNAKMRHKGSVLGVYVSEQARGLGVGRALMAALIAHVRAAGGVEQLMLAVAVTQDAARALYRSLGFEVFGYERRALKVGEEYVDEEHMVLWLA